MPTPSWPGMNGGVGLTGQSPLRSVDVGVAQPGRLDTNEDLVDGRLRDRAVLDLERLTELRDNGGFHDNSCVDDG